MSQGMAPRHYTREFKTEAVELSLRPGMRVKQVAKDLGIPGESKGTFYFFDRWNR